MFRPLNKMMTQHSATWRGAFDLREGGFPSPASDSDKSVPIRLIKEEREGSRYIYEWPVFTGERIYASQWIGGYSDSYLGNLVTGCIL